MLIDLLNGRWERMIGALGLSIAGTVAARDELLKAWSAPGRFYHNLDHLAFMLSLVDLHDDEADHPHLVRLATWYHDAIYDPRAGDNEERSAVLAETTARAWGMAEEQIWRVGELIRATRTHEAAEDERDASLLLDADLAILGADEETYDAYASAIRQEYGWVSDEDYRRGRSNVLARFLERPRLYRLKRVRKEREAQARLNLSRELERLK